MDTAAMDTNSAHDKAANKPVLGGPVQCNDADKPVLQFNTTVDRDTTAGLPRCTSQPVQRSDLGTEVGPVCHSVVVTVPDKAEAAPTKTTAEKPRANLWKRILACTISLALCALAASVCALILSTPSTQVTTVTIHVGTRVLPIKAAVQSGSHGSHRWHLLYKPTDLNEHDTRRDCAHRVHTDGFEYTFFSPECTFSPSTITSCVAQSADMSTFDASSITIMIAKLEEKLNGTHSEITTMAAQDVPFAAPAKCETYISESTSTFTSVEVSTSASNTGVQMGKNGTSGSSPSRRHLSGHRKNCEGREEMLHFGATVDYTGLLPPPRPTGKDDVHTFMTHSNWWDDLRSSDEDTKVATCKALVQSNSVKDRLERERDAHKRVEAGGGWCHQAHALEWGETSNVFFFIGASWGWYFGVASMTNDPDKVQCFAGWLTIAMTATFGVGLDVSEHSYTSLGFVDLDAVTGRAMVYEVGAELGISAAIPKTPLAAQAATGRMHVHVNDNNGRSRQGKMIGKGTAVVGGLKLGTAGGIDVEVGPSATLFANTYSPGLIDPDKWTPKDLCYDVGDGNEHMCDSGKEWGGLCYNGYGSLPEGCHVGIGNGKYCAPNGRKFHKEDGVYVGAEHWGRCLGTCLEEDEPVNVGGHHYCCSGKSYFSWFRLYCTAP